MEHYSTWKRAQGLAHWLSAFPSGKEVTAQKGQEPWHMGTQEGEFTPT